MLRMAILIMVLLVPQAVLSEPMEYAVALRTTGDDDADMRMLRGARKVLVREALKMLGKPYVWGANGPNAYDCSGFMKAVYGKFGIKIPRVSFDQGKAGAQVKLNLKSLKAGDLIYFKIDRKTGWPHHVGMYVGHGKFIHCASGKGVVLEDILTSKLRVSVHMVSRIIFTEAQAKRLGVVTATMAASRSRYDPESRRVIR